MNPSGKLVAAVGSEGWMKVFDLDSRRVTEDFPSAAGAVNVVRWMGESRLVTAGADRTVRILEPGKPVRKLLGAAGEILSLAVASAGDIAVVGSADRHARVFDLAGALSPNRLTGHAGGVSGLTFGADSGTVISAGQDNVLLVHDVTKPQPTGKIYVGGDRVEAFAFEPGKDCVVVGSGNGSVEIHEPIAGRKRGAFTVAGRPIRALAIAPGEKFIAALDAGGKLRVMNGAGDTERHGRELGVDGAALAVAPDGGTLAVAGGDEKVRLLETEKFTARGEFTVPSRSIRAMLFDSSGRIVIAADNTIHVHSPSGEPLGRLEGHGQAIRSLHVLPGGARLISGAADGVVKIWDLGTLEELLSLDPISIGCSAITSTSDGRRLLLGGADGSITVLDAPAINR
jgi:WD40 repeat protein